MIIKRIRRGRRRVRGSVAMTMRVVTALSAYIVDADPERLKALDKVIDLSRYLADLHGHEGGERFAPGEKVAALGTRNLRGHDLAAWQDELVAAAARCPRSHAPAEHYVISLKEGERFGDGQAGEAVDIFLKVLGAESCPVLWAVHDNTDDEHVHVVVVRVDMRDGSAVTLGDGWDIDRLHQAVALIEERQGWAAEPKALYVARDGEVFERSSNHRVRDADGRQMPRPRRRAEPSTALNARTRDLIGVAVSRAADWQDFHRQLAEHAIFYHKAGSGARIEISGESHKASALHSDWSRASLERRLGPFVPRRTGDGLSYEEYRFAATAELARIRSVHADARAQLRTARAHALAGLAGPHAAVLRLAITAEFANALEALDGAFAGAKARFASDRMSLGQWHDAGGPAMPKDAILPAMILPANMGMPERAVATPSGFVADNSGWHTDYRDRDGRCTWTDYRVLVAVRRGNVPTVEAAILLAAQRWGTLRIEGSPAFLRMAADVAARHGIVVVDARGMSLPAPVVTSREIDTRKPDRPPASAMPNAPLAPAPIVNAVDTEDRRHASAREAPSTHSIEMDEELARQWWSASRGHGR